MRLASGTDRAGHGSRVVCLLFALFTVACVQMPTGERLCKDAPACDCPAAADHGAVVVRWRVSDGQAGQLLGRGDCCCIPDGAPPSDIAGRQCQRFGISCPKSPAWLIQKVQLRVTPVDGSGPTCIITKPCVDAELTTEYCLAPGLYDMQVTADIDVLEKSCPSGRDEFVCSGRQAISPPSVRRRITGGQAVNLDGIVLGVNPPPLSTSSDGGTDFGMCSATADGGT